MAATVAEPGVAPRVAGRRAVWGYLMLTWRKYWLSSLTQAVGAPLLYLLAMGLGLGSLVNRGQGSASLGVPYLDWIAPALLAAAALQTAVGEASYPAFSRFKWNRVFWGISATPVTPGQLADGQLLFIGTRLLVGSGLFYLVLLAFGSAGGPAGVLLIGIGVLIGAGCAAWVLVVSAWITSEGGAFNTLFRFVVIPMTLFSGSFFPIERIPIALRWLAWLSPLWHGNELARAAALGIDEPWATVGHLAYLVALLVSGVLVARWRFGRRLVV